MDEIDKVAKLIHESYMRELNGELKDSDIYDNIPKESGFRRAYRACAKSVIEQFKEDVGEIGIIRRIIEESKIIASIKVELELMYGLVLNISDCGHVNISIIKGPDVKYGESPILSVINSMKEAGEDVPR